MIEKAGQSGSHSSREGLMMAPSEVDRIGCLCTSSLDALSTQACSRPVSALRHVPRISRLLEVPSSSGFSSKHRVRFTQSAGALTLLRMA